MHTKHPEDASLLTSEFRRYSYERFKCQRVALPVEGATRIPPAGAGRARGAARPRGFVLMRKALAFGAVVLLINALSFNGARAQDNKTPRNRKAGAAPKTPKPRKVVARKPPPTPIPCEPDIPLPSNIQDYYDPSTVLVQVSIDEQGRVTSTRVISGAPSLRQRAVEAALRKRYEPKIMFGRPVKVDGLLTYKFDISSKPAKGPYEYDPHTREVSSEGSGPD
jgi:hypothetical protein